MRSTSIGLALAAAAVTLAARPATSGGQAPLEGRVLFGAEVGGRHAATGPTALQVGKFEEYKSAPTGMLLEQLFLGYQPPDSFRLFQLAATRVGQSDQSAALRASEPGLFDVQLRWDRILHTFSSNARSLGSQLSPDVFVLPRPRPDTGTWNRTAPFLSPIRTQWGVVKVATTYTPSPIWDFKAEYTGFDKTGERPMGMAFGSPGNNLREILEPIEQKMHDVKLTQAFSAERFQMTAMYDLSMFRNGYTSVTSDNPLLILDTPTAGSSRGRTALAPDNVAHTAVVNGALSLPLHTRLNGSGSYSWWKQDAAFIPATINSAITDPRIATMPTSLGGGSGTSSFNVSVTSRPVAAVALAVKFRTFSFRDNVGVDSVPVLVVSDRSVSPAAARLRFPSTRNNTDAGLTWRLQPVTVGVGYSWDHWARSEQARNVYRTNDNAARASVDVDARSWLSLRTAYTRGHRRASDPYIQNSPDDLPEHRRFDQADRDRERTNVIAFLTPIDAVSVSANWGVGSDEYPASLYGTQSDRSTMLGGDVAWAASDRFSIYAGHSRETFRTRLKSRFRTGTQLNNLSYDWVANNDDVVATTNAGFEAVLIPDRLETGGRLDISRARFMMATFNPTTPTGGTAAQNLAATAGDLPEVTQHFQPMMLFARYRFLEDWAATLRLQTERFEQNDFRTLGLVPAEGNGIFLGNNFENYSVTFVTVSISFRPQLLRLGRSAL